MIWSDLTRIVGGFLIGAPLTLIIVGGLAEVMAWALGVSIR